MTFFQSSVDVVLSFFLSLMKIVSRSQLQESFDSASIEICVVALDASTCSASAIDSEESRSSCEERFSQQVVVSLSFSHNSCVSLQFSQSISSVSDE